MPAPEWENLDAFFGLDDFAVPVSIRRGEAVLWEGSAILEDGNSAVALGDLEQTLGVPHLICPSEAVLAVQDLDVAIVDGVTWDVLGDPQRDGTGVTRVMLAKPNVAFRA